MDYRRDSDLGHQAKSFFSSFLTYLEHARPSTGCSSRSASSSACYSVEPRAGCRVLAL